MIWGETVFHLLGLYLDSQSFKFVRGIYLPHHSVAIDVYKQNLKLLAILPLVCFSYLSIYTGD